jgi:CRP-like cAMP-binding protein
MSTDSLIARSCSSLFLSLLPQQDFEILQPHLELVNLKLKDVICERGQPIRYVYFPCTCALSVITITQDGGAVEVATVGNEGFSGIDVIAGANVAINTTVCQVAGSSYRMRTATFKELITENAALREIAITCLHAYLGQMSQSVACNRLHHVEERFARWILLTHDRVRSNEFHITQEFIAIMLGVHRPSVSVVAGSFQQAGIIRYTRGHMIILDREKLEEAACECYAVVAAHFNKLLGTRRG